MDEFMLGFVVKNEEHRDLPKTVLSSAALIPRAGDKVVLQHETWSVLERSFNFSLKPVGVTLVLGR